MMGRAQRVIAGNWKMNLGPSAARRLAAELAEAYESRDDRLLILFPPSLSLSAVRDELADREDIRLGVQNVYWEEAGAFTGELSATMAADAGAEFALIGHSERRHLFHESIKETQRKMGAVLGAGLRPLLCVGETLSERRAGQAQETVRQQLDPVFKDLDPEQADALLIAYEPVWAIGTGETASPADASEMHGFIRILADERFGPQRAAAIPILYGGSVKPANAKELLAAAEVDGVLVGGASLGAESFARIASGGLTAS